MSSCDPLGCRSQEIKDSGPFSQYVTGAKNQKCVHFSASNLELSLLIATDVLSEALRVQRCEAVWSSSDEIQLPESASDGQLTVLTS